MTRFLHHDLGYRQAGDVVEIQLSGSAANIRLLDSSSFERYQRRQDHRYVGGLARQSPVRLAVPNDGRWHLAIDMQGLRGTTRASVRVIPAAALRPQPPIQQSRSPLHDIAQNIAEAPSHSATEPETRDYDVFISHAAEDSTIDEIAAEIASVIGAPIAIQE